jgi:hypothetical protein
MPPQSRQEQVAYEKARPRRPGRGPLERSKRNQPPRRQQRTLNARLCAYRASKQKRTRLASAPIIEGRELKQLLAEALNMDVLISLPVVPRGWARADIA